MDGVENDRIKRVEAIIFRRGAWGPTSTSRLSYFLETDGLTHEEISIIEESLQGKQANRGVVGAGAAVEKES